MDWPKTAQEACKNGSEFLTENFPDWKEVIDLASFDMGDTYYCVAGQVADGIVPDSQEKEGSLRWEWVIQTLAISNQEAVLYGFNNYPYGDTQEDGDYPYAPYGLGALETEWKKVLTK